MTQTRMACVAICLVIFVNFLQSTVVGASVPSLEWDPNPEPYVAGYNVYAGEKSHTYTRIIDVGSKTSLPLTNLNPGVTYYFAVTAYDANRLESPLSDEVSYTPRVNGTNASLVPLKVLMSNSGAVVQFYGVAGQLCRVVASSDLVRWEEIYSFIVMQSGMTEFLDESMFQPRRFYRIVATTAPPRGTIVN